MIFDAYYTMNKPEWINQENKEYRDNTELRFAEYYKKHKEMWDAMPDTDKMMVSNGVRSRTVNDGMRMEAVTIWDWLKHIEKIGKAKIVRTKTDSSGMKYRNKEYERNNKQY